MSQGRRSVASSTQVTSKSSANKWFGLAALLVVGLVGWSLTSESGGGSGSNDEAGIEGAGGVEPAVEAPDGSPTTTAEKVAVDEEMMTEEIESPPDTVDPGAPVGVASMPDEEGPIVHLGFFSDLVLLTESGERAILDAPIGLSVLVGGSGGTIQIVELDTAQLLEVRGVLGDLVLLTETHLLQMTNSGSVHAWALADLAAEPVLLNTEFGHPEVSGGPEPNQAWLLTRGGDNNQSPNRTLVDLDTGKSIRSYGLTVAVSPVQGGPGDLVNAWGGGVFEEIGGGQFQRFASGWAIAANHDLVLVRRCSISLDCSALWLDRGTGAILDLPSPQVSDFIWWGSVIDPTSTWLWDRSPDSVGLIEIATGKTTELAGIEPWPGPSFSPGGLWATYFDQDHRQIQVIELETGRIYHLERRFNGGQAAFVATDSLIQHSK